jgi:hypothetical protein
MSHFKRRSRGREDSGSLVDTPLSSTGSIIHTTLIIRIPKQLDPLQELEIILESAFDQLLHWDDFIDPKRCDETQG